ncbi:hypothetical protein [Nannocystis sp. SCPEA4]|uniref:hypothetical protein n=1 Tax=Nannocystis sp. SCPEA4 TaxID=2996787 RepID=UPI00227030B0|nr:hypothetical protein [Nannocystis sp. SCPEA4]MCY1059112.1 hypothetical protein [Nannocystis sp. SCPEA4]
MAGLLLRGLLATAPVAEPDEVQWIAPAGCPTREALLAGIAARRGRELEPGLARVVARTTVVAPRRYRLELELDIRGRRENRALVARTCAALVDGAALLIALAVDGELDPTAASPAPPPPGPVAGEIAPEPAAQLEPPPEPVVPPVSSPEPTVPPAPGSSPEPAQPASPAPAAPPVGPLDLASADPMPPSRPRPGGFLRLHGLGEFGALPQPTGGVGLAGGLLWPWFRLELQANYLAPRPVERLQTRVRASLFAAAVLGCVRLGGRRRFEFPVCLGLEAGGLAGVADGPSGHRTAIGRWLAATGGLGAIVRVHPRVALFAFLQGLAAFQRGTFVLTAPKEDRPLFDPGIGSGRLALGVELRFGEPR